MASLKRFGNYFLIKKIAAGGMAELYKARKPGEKGFEKLLAIKMILPHLAASDDFISMFIDEAKVAALLNHQNIVQIYDLGRIEESYCIVMEYVRGKDLRTVLSRGAKAGRRLRVEHACLVTANALAGLAYAHRMKDKGEELGIVHRDISPQNILISYEGEVKIVDFGIAKAATQSRDTQAGVLKGKLSYMSPEQAMGKPIDMRSDIFSTGIVLYEALTGRKLFQGDTDIGTLELVRAARVEPLPTNLDTKFPPRLEAIALKALAKDPADRYRDASEMETALLEFMRDAGYSTSGRSLSEYMYGLFKDDIEEEIKEERMMDETVVPDSIYADTLAGPAGGVAGKPTAPKPAHAAKPAPAPPTRAAAQPVSVGPETSRKSNLALVLAVLAALALAGAFVGSKVMDRRAGRGSMSVQAAPALPATDATAAPSSGGAAKTEKPGQAEGKPAEAAPVPGKPGPGPKASPVTAVITSEPPGAGVYVDGKNAGVTPLRMSGYEPDKDHRVRVAREGYRDWAGSFRAGPGGEGNVHAVMVELTSAITASSSPAGAKIFIDGRDTGKTTPGEVSGLRPGGQYTVNLRMPGFAPYEETVSPGPAGVARVSATLVRQYGELNVNAKPWAVVFVDGEEKGTTPLAGIRLTAGEHRLLLANPRMGIKKRARVSIKPDETTRVVIDLGK